MDGIINVYKEQGYTSFDVVARLRGILKQKKIGHTGTLDPMAEGVLVVCLGSATKLVDLMTLEEKCYRATMRLGITTDTEDIMGRVLTESSLPDTLTDEKVTEAVLGYVGTYEQLPPMYSAIKKDGKKLYEYARAGIEVVRTPRKVTVYSITDIAVSLPDVSFAVHCSKGTYIRSLCRDIGNTLGCGGTMTALLREEVHGLRVEDALRLSDIEARVGDGTILSCITPMDTVLKQYNAKHVREPYIKYITNGNKLYPNQFEENSTYTDGEVVRVYAGEKLVALYRYENAENKLRPYKMFLTNKI